MATFTPLELNFDYQPSSLNELILPLSVYKTEYDKRIADIDARRDGLAAFAPYINESTPEAKAMYESLDAQIENNAQYIGSPGYLLHEKPIRALKSEYGKKVSDFTNAVKNLEERKALTIKEQSAHPGLVYNYRDNDGNLVESPNIDHYLGNKGLGFYSVDTDDMMNKAAALAKGISSRLVHMAAGANVTTADNANYGRVYEFADKESGMPVIVALSWFLDPEGHKAEIDAFKETHKGKEYQDLFNSSVADDISNLKSQSDYYKLTPQNQRRVDDAIEFGFNSGLGPHDINRHRNLGGAPSSRGSEITPKEQAVRTRPKLAVSEAIDTEGYDEFQDLKKYFNVDDTNFWDLESDELPIQGMFSMQSLGRVMGEDYSEGDKHLNESTSNFDLDKFKDWFTPFDDSGNIYDKDSFVTKFGDRLDEATAKEYIDAMEADPNFGDYYKKYYYGNVFSRSRNSNAALPTSTPNGLPIPNSSVFKKHEIAKNTYDEFARAALAAYEVPKEKRKEILDDKTGKKFFSWADQNNVNRYSLQKKMWDLADKYSNVTVENVYLRFKGDNEPIVKDILQNNVSNNGELNLKEVTGYKFKKDGNGVKRIYTETKDVSESWDYAFPGYKGVTFMLPQDPSEGIIINVADTGKSYLVEPNLLGNNLYNAPYMVELKNTIDDSRKVAVETERGIRAMFGLCSKMNVGGKLSKKDKDLIRSLGFEPKNNVSDYTPEERSKITITAEPMIDTMRAQRLAAISLSQEAMKNIAQYLKDNISSVYEPTENE